MGWLLDLMISVPGAQCFFAHEANVLCLEKKPGDGAPGSAAACWEALIVIKILMQSVSL